MTKIKGVILVTDELNGNQKKLFRILELQNQVAESYRYPMNDADKIEYQTLLMEIQEALK